MVPLEQLLPISVIAGENCFCGGFPQSVQDGLERIRTRPLEKTQQVDIFISHKPPEKYPSFPYVGMAQIEKRPRWVIGRR